MITPVIMCGGAGTRLWPASRSDNPKPFLPLVDGSAIAEAARAAVVDANFDWSDLGTWAAVWDADSHDAAGRGIAGRPAALQAGAE